MRIPLTHYPHIVFIEVAT